MALTKVDKSVSSTPGIVDNSDATAITIDSNENIGIGTTSPSMKVNISHGDQDGLRFNCANTAETFIDFGDTDDNDIGQISYDHADNHMAFTTNTAERMRIDTSGNVGIGTTSPGTKLHIRTSESTSNHNSGGGFHLVGNSTAGSRLVNIFLDPDGGNFSTSSDGAYAYLEKVGGGGDFKLINQDTSNMIFQTSGTERMRIDSLGRVMVAATSANEIFEVKGAMGLQAGNSTNRWSLYTYTDNTLRFNYNGAGGDELTMNSSGDFAIGKSSFGASTAGFAITNSGINVYSSASSASSSTYHAHDGTNFKFYVGYNGTIYAMNTSIYNLSDERMKENIRDLDKGLSDILKLKPRRFDWKEGEGTYEKNISGFIAQEVEDAGFDEFVSNFKHKTLDDAKSFGQGGLIPALVKAIQEQQVIIEDLQTQINEVKNGN